MNTEMNEKSDKRWQKKQKILRKQKETYKNSNHIPNENLIRKN